MFYRDGFVRRCCERYEVGSNNLSVHLTNQYQQKKSPLYSEVKVDTVSQVDPLAISVPETNLLQIWDFEKLQEHVSVEYGLPADWVGTTLTVSMVTGLEPL